MLDAGKLGLKIAALPAQSNFADDQVWELALGQNDEPAISLQTQYGGRVGLARLVVMLRIGNEPVYERQQFLSDVKVTGFTSDSVEVTATPTNGLTLTVLFHAVSSQLLAGVITLTSTAETNLRVEIFGQAMLNKAAVPMNMLSLTTPQNTLLAALALGNIGNLEPVLMLENAEETAASKLTSAINIPGGQRVSLKFVHAGFTTLDDSINKGYALLKKDWTPHLQNIEQQRKQFLFVDTDDDNLDAAVMLSQQIALQSLIKNSQLPHPTAVFLRTPAQGFSFKGDGSDYGRGWNGQNALDTFQLGTALIVVNPDLAKGLIKNYIAMQQTDGTINHQGFMVAPMLAQLTALIYRHTGDQAFVDQVYPALVKFYTRWFAFDGDKDGFPEWQSTIQMNIDYHPLASLSIDPSLVEAPDLAALLLAEGEALAVLAPKKSDWKKPYEQLKKALASSWDGKQFIYHDRDTDQVIIGEHVYKGKGDQSLAQSVKLQRPNRLTVRIEGGVDHQPRVKVTVKGLDREGKSASEILEHFQWYRSAGTATTRQVWSQIDQLNVEGLSRVYDVKVDTPDLNRQDISLLLPYITEGISAAQAKGIQEQVKTSYLDQYGLASLPDHADDIGRRVVLPYATLLGLAMLKRGHPRASLEIFERITAAQIKSLIGQGRFFQWYHVAEGTGFGLPDHTTGIIPLYWFMNLAGIFIRDAHTVEIIGNLIFKKRIQIEQYGVKIVRSSRKTIITFANGHRVELPASAPPQIIKDS